MKDIKWMPLTHIIVDVNTAALTLPDGKRCVDKAGYIAYTYESNTSQVYYWQIRQDTKLDLSTVFPGQKVKVKIGYREDRMNGWDWLEVHEVQAVKKAKKEVVLDNELFSKPKTTFEQFQDLFEEAAKDEMTEAQLALLAFIATKVDEERIKFK